MKVPPESVPACVAVFPVIVLVTVRVVYAVYCVWPLGMVAAIRLIETDPLILSAKPQ